MTDKETAIFLEQMADVKPLAGNGVRCHFPIAMDDETLRTRRRARDSAELISRLATAPELIPRILPDDIACFKREGVQDAVFKNLRLGKYPARMLLDLRGYKLTQAKDTLVSFILDAREMGERNALIIHGKGLHGHPNASQTTAASIKSCVCHWLKQVEQVLAYHSAKQEHGGTGALYLMLEKSPQMRLLTRETNRKGKGFR